MLLAGLAHGVVVRVSHARLCIDQHKSRELDTDQRMLLDASPYENGRRGAMESHGERSLRIQLSPESWRRMGVHPAAAYWPRRACSPRHGTVPALERGNYRKRRVNAYALPSQYGMLEDAGKKVLFSQILPIKQATFVYYTS